MSKAADRSAVKAAQEKLRASLQGQKRTEQYVVEAQKKIVEEVSTEEYKKIVDQRRDDFVVGDVRSGYQDGGKEIWEDSEAVKERSKETAKASAKAAAGKTQSGAAEKELRPSPSKKDNHTPEKTKTHLLQAFNAGASSAGGGLEVPSAAFIGNAETQQELDDMLMQMCDDVEMGGDHLPPAAPTPGSQGKRKPEVAPAGEAANKKKTTAKPTTSTISQPFISTGKFTDSQLASTKQESPVKQEPKDVEMKTFAFTGPSVKAEIEEAKTKPAGAAQAVASPSKVEQVNHEPPSVKVEAPPAIVKAEVQSASPSKGDVVDSKTSNQGLDEWLQPTVPPAEQSEPLAPGNRRLQTQEDGSLWFFFVDAFEDDRTSPPRVYLFGKVRVGAPGSAQFTYQSCCLVVEQLERCVHLALNVPDDDEETANIAAKEAETEFGNLCRQQCPGIKPIRCKLKFRNYAFEKTLSVAGGGCLPFLKIVFDASGSMPPVGMQGNSFTHMFGAQTSLLERLLMTRRIMGPSWLLLKANTFREDAAKLSFCGLELRITPASICCPKSDADRRALQDAGMPTSSPPLRIMSLSMQTFQKNPQQPHEPVAISCTLHPHMGPDASATEKDLRMGMTSWTGVRRMDTRPLPRNAEMELAKNKVEHYNNEIALFMAFLGKVQEFDPDVIAGHTSYGFDLDVIASRMQGLRINAWQKLGRLRRQGARMPQVQGRQGAGFWVGTSLTAGRLVCDVSLQAKDMLPKLGQYDLVTLAQKQLNNNFVRVIEPENLASYYDSAQSLLELVRITNTSALAIAYLMLSLQLLPLTKQLTNLAGNTWNASLQNKRAERNEMLLCHEFHNGKFICPDKESLLAKKSRMAGKGGGGAGFDDAEEQEPAADTGTGPRRGKAQYTGGLVLEPKVGLYDDFVMMLDFNSLYPSIIQEHNICFTTVDRPDENEVAMCEGEADLLKKTQLPDGTDTEGVLPQVLRRLVESRRSVKMSLKGEKDPRMKQILEIRQLALKLTANSMYGCLGFQNSRFYAKPLAALITKKGREALQTTINVVEQECALEVVYGDTDSVFVNTKTSDFEQANQAAQQIKRSVNKRYKRLEIEIDGTFSRLMLLKKKKYAGVKIVDWHKKIFENEWKGLDIVRRDWCPLAKEIGTQVLTKVLDKDGKEESVQWIHNYLEQKKIEMDEMKVPLESYVITKGLTKDPRDYPDAKNQAHVQVAFRLENRGKAVRAGQEVGFVITEATEDAPKASMSERARDPHEFELDKNLKIDIAWYKKQQVHPLVSRLLGPVEGTDAGRVAECLGMEAKAFAPASAGGYRDYDDGYSGADAVSSDLSALFDRNLRWKEFRSSLAGVECLKCKELVAWKQLLQPEALDQDGFNAMFKCSACSEPVNPVRARNLLTLQLKKMLREHAEGWVCCADEAGIEKTRRATGGVNMVGERVVFRELEYIEHLCESEPSTPSGEQDKSDAMRQAAMREAAEAMRQAARFLLETNGCNWVDCGKIFGSIFGESTAAR